MILRQILTNQIQPADQLFSGKSPEKELNICCRTLWLKRTHVANFLGICVCATIETKLHAQKAGTRMVNIPPNYETLGTAL